MAVCGGAVRVRRVEALKERANVCKNERQAGVREAPEGKCVGASMPAINVARGREKRNRAERRSREEQIETSKAKEEQ